MSRKQPRVAKLRPGQELCCVATKMPSMFELLTHTGSVKAVEKNNLATLPGLVGVNPDGMRNACYYFFEGVASAKAGKAAIEAAGIECKPDLFIFVVASDGVPEYSYTVKLSSETDVEREQPGEGARE